MARTLPRPRVAELNAAAVEVEVGLRGARASGPLLGVGPHVSSVPLLARADRGVLRVHTARGVLTARGVSVPAGLRHSLEAAGPVTVWYLEPGTLDWPELRPGGAHVLSPARLRQLRVVDRELSRSPGRVAHAGVSRVLEALARDPSLDTPALAELAKLSPSRLRHAFLEQVGVNVSRYRWWLRLRLAALAMKEGHSLTHAAHEAGFADAAHFSRTFRRTFGFVPSLLVRAAGWARVRSTPRAPRR